MTSSPRPSVKYEITAEHHPNRPGLRRIVALRDIARHGVSAGDVGGWVAGPDSLSDTGDAWVDNSAIVSGAARVSGNAYVTGNAVVTDHAQVHGSAVVAGAAILDGHSEAAGNAHVAGRGRISEFARIHGHAHLAGAARLSGHAEVCGNAVIDDHAQVSGSARVTGDASLGGYVRMNAGEISDDAFVSEDGHVLTIGPIGAHMLTAYRTRGGHRVRVGSWCGSVSDLRERFVAPRAVPAAAVAPLCDLVDSHVTAWRVPIPV